MKNLLDLSKKISKYCVGMEGNVSMRLVDSFFIKASGSKLCEVTQDDFVEYDFHGVQKSNFSKKGSMELGFHNFLLSQKDIKFVAHTHPINVLKILCTEFASDFSKKRIFPDQVVFNGKTSCLVPYVKPGDELANLVKKEYNRYVSDNNSNPKIILLQNHGIITFGSTVDECVINTEICEKSAEIFLGSLMSGGIKFLTDGETNDILYDKKETYRYNLVK